MLCTLDVVNHMYYLVAVCQPLIKGSFGFPMIIQPSVLSWNVWGLNCLNRRATVSETILVPPVRLFACKKLGSTTATPSLPSSLVEIGFVASLKDRFRGRAEEFYSCGMIRLLTSPASQSPLTACRPWFMFEPRPPSSTSPAFMALLLLT